MNKERDHYYVILGLQPGASPEEIKAAFRDLTKLYHPDHDSSLDAEMKCKEIRTAYDALKRGTKAWPEADSASHGYSPPPSSEKHEDTTKGYRTAHGKEQRYVKDDWDDENSSFDFADLMWENEDKKRLKKRLPFTLENLPRILQVSFNEVFSVGMAIRVLLMVFWLWSALVGVGWGSVMTFCAILFVLPGALLYRYYFQYFGSRFPVWHVANMFLCSVALAILYVAMTNQSYLVLRVQGVFFVTYHTFHGRGIIFVHLVWWVFISLFSLWMRNYLLLIAVYLIALSIAHHVVWGLSNLLWG